MSQWETRKEGMTEELKESLSNLESITLIMEMGEVAHKHRVMVSLTVSPYDEEPEKMPAKSQKQRAYIYGTKGPGWAKKHHFNNKGKLPKTSRKKKK